MPHALFSAHPHHDLSADASTGAGEDTVRALDELAHDTEHAAMQVVLSAMLASRSPASWWSDGDPTS